MTADNCDLIQPEADFDIHQHWDGVSVLHRGLEAPLADGFDGLFVQAQTERLNHAQPVRAALCVDDGGDGHSSLHSSLAGFIRVFRLRFVEHTRLTNTSADRVDSIPIATACSGTKSRAVAVA